MNGFFHVTGADFAAVAPEIVLCLSATLILLLDAFARPLRSFLPYVALASLVLPQSPRHVADVPRRAVAELPPLTQSELVHRCDDLGRESHV